jgi:hypothetical protein
MTVNSRFKDFLLNWYITKILDYHSDLILYLAMSFISWINVNTDRK